ncbi:MAG: disulfide bond formation protein B, partial [Pseudomonadota bacterium]
DVLASLSTPGPAGPSCNEAAWRLMGISMAGYNTLASLFLTFVVGIGFRETVRQNRKQGSFVITQTS